MTLRIAGGPDSPDKVQASIEDEAVVACHGCQEIAEEKL